jgi:hypothetical protein
MPASPGDVQLRRAGRLVEDVMPWSRGLATGAAAGAAAVAGLAVRYAAGVARADRSWPAGVEAGLRDVGEVGEVSILPLVERLTRNGSGLTGEPGVSYLVRAGEVRVLFDSGLSGGKMSSALARNAEKLGVDLGTLDAVVISHLHPDDVGGIGAARQRTFTFSRERLEPRGCQPTCPSRCGTRAPR